MEVGCALRRISWTTWTFCPKPALIFYEPILYLQNKLVNVKNVERLAQTFHQSCSWICHSLHCGFKADQTSSKNLWHFHINKCFLCYHWLTLRSSDSIYIQFLKAFPIAVLHCPAPLFSPVELGCSISNDSHHRIMEGVTLLGSTEQQFCILNLTRWISTNDTSWSFPKAASFDLRVFPPRKGNLQFRSHFPR